MALAKSYGDKLVVGLNTDELIFKDKGRESILPYSQRKEIVEAVRYVDLVIPCDQELALPYLEMLDADVFVLTEEWRERHLTTGIAYMEAKGGQVVYSPRWPDITFGTQIRRKLYNEFHDQGAD
jgi:glycerol-3-phosphate cytidylyltransferase